MLHIPPTLTQGLVLLTFALNGGHHQRVPHSPPCRYQSTSPLRRKHPFLAAYSKVVRSVTERYNLVEPGLPVSPPPRQPGFCVVRAPILCNSVSYVRRDDEPADLYIRNTIHCKMTTRRRSCVVWAEAKLKSCTSHIRSSRKFDKIHWEFIASSLNIK